MTHKQVVRFQVAGLKRSWNLRLGESCRSFQTIGRRTMAANSSARFHHNGHNAKCITRSNALNSGYSRTVSVSRTVVSNRFAAKKRGRFLTKRITLVFAIIGRPIRLGCMLQPGSYGQSRRLIGRSQAGFFKFSVSDVFLVHYHVTIEIHAGYVTIHAMLLK